MSAIPEIDVQELNRRLDADEDLVLLDVRQPVEHQTGNLGGILIPLQQLPYRLEELDAYRDRPLLVYCRTGNRSGKAVAFLQHQGFSGAMNLQGGVVDWRDEIDPAFQVH